MKKRMISILLSILMILSFLPVTAFAEFVPVTVIFNTGDGDPVRVSVEKDTLIPAEKIPVLTRLGDTLFDGWYATSDCSDDLFDFSKPVTDSIALYAKWVSPYYMKFAENGQSYLAKWLSDDTVLYSTLTGTARTSLDSGWYFIGGRVNVSERITVSGEVNLVLGESCYFNVPKGIEMSEDCKLTIFAQNVDSGRLMIKSPAENNGAIAGYGSLTINGGEIYTQGGAHAPALGGFADVTINAGIVTALAGSSDSVPSPCGIGSIDRCEAGKITINGGTVTAKGSSGGGAAIGGSVNGGHKGIYINGGTIDAYSPNACGIGSGRYLTNGEVYISGGNIKAVSDKNGAGIGGSKVIITGGVIYATAKDEHPGIGCTSKINVNAYVEISDAVIEAHGGSKGGPGIGNAYKSSTIKIANSEIKAYGGGNDAIGGSQGFGSDPQVIVSIPENKTVSVTNSSKVLSAVTSKDQDDIYGAIKGKTTAILTYSDSDLFHTVSIEEVSGGETKAAVYSGMEGQSIALTTTTNNGYLFHHYELASGGGSVSKDSYRFGTEDGVIRPVFLSNLGAPYIDQDGSRQTTGVYSVVETAATTLENGWYVVNSVLKNNNRLEVKGNVNLIIEDGAFLYLPLGIHVPAGASLTVYGQEESSGELYINNTASDNAGIGGNKAEAPGDIIINGCHIDVAGGKNAYAIGGGSNSKSTKTYVQNGGSVTVTDGFTDEHTHTYSGEYSSNERFHWLAGTCEHSVLRDFAPHTFGAGVKDGDKITYTCAVCGYEKTETLPETAHEHTFSDEYSANEYCHWYAATCAHTDLAKGIEAHRYYEKLMSDGTIKEVCMYCDYVKPVDELKIALDNTVKALAEANAALNDKTAALNTAETKLTAAEAALAGAQDALNEKTAALADSQAKLAAAENALRAAEAQTDELTAELAKARKDLEAARKDFSDAADELEIKKARIDTLTEELEKAGAEIERLRNGEDPSCPYCGKEKHENFFDKFVCFFKKIGYFFRILFDFSI